jgi:uncharacterized membrane protein (Fun14 family)
MILEAIDVGGLGLGFGTGGAVGAVVGFAAKKLAKALAIVLGVQLAALKFLEARGILHVDREALSAHLVAIAANADDVPSWLLATLSTLSLGTGFVAGFLLGFRRG